jgi:hypothetical protein
MGARVEVTAILREEDTTEADFFCEGYGGEVPEPYSCALVRALQMAHQFVSGRNVEHKCIVDVTFVLRGSDAVVEDERWFVSRNTRRILNRRRVDAGADATRTSEVTLLCDLLRAEHLWSWKELQEKLMAAHGHRVTLKRLHQLHAEAVTVLAKERAGSSQ